jgi:hypothetical protein
MAAGPKKESDPNDKSLWLKDFFQAMCKPDWREWVAAVKKEIESWLVFNAYSEIAFVDRKPGSSIVPLGELFILQGRQMEHTSSVSTLWATY